ncbi:hypothetical protein [Castellaniella defragrans]|uniref:Ca2+-binding RTX toxin-like protein n=1 Tax=Castellaniella defragrans TaxID=75697 RepID=A0A7W9TPF7_CASDE|nr:hypothetical protein [Castellaniella defragrans]KAB0608393.1 hypothetical protein F7Q88_13055 [Castellaniella defragrans]MBB6084101.1 Ca2+-binding RTX toxin-like protein [Castellaniella defragrans]
MTAHLSAETALTINGVEMVGLTPGTDTGVVDALYDNHIQGSALDILVDGGEAGAMQILGLDSIGLSVERDSTATIRAGAGDDIIVLLSAAHSTVTVDADAGSDIIAAGAGIDTVDGLAVAATGTYAGVGIVGPNGAIGTEGDGVIFSFGGNAYVWMQGANDTAFDDGSFIQLTGVNADLLEIDGGDGAFA